MAKCIFRWLLVFLCILEAPNGSSKKAVLMLVIYHGAVILSGDHASAAQVVNTFKFQLTCNAFPAEGTPAIHAVSDARYLPCFSRERDQAIIGHII